MATRRRSRFSVLVVLLTISAATVLFAGPTGAALEGTPGPLVAVDFIGAATNDDGIGGDGDDGGPAASYNLWAAESSADPSEPGPGATRADKDVGKCTAEVRAANPNYVDVAIANGYPGYVCTFDVVVENGSVVPATVSPALLDADTGLTLLEGATQLATTLGPGEQGEASFSLGIEQIADRGTVLTGTVTLVFTAEYGRILVDKVTDPAGDPAVFDFEADWGDTFSLTDEDPPYDSGPLIPGTYAITETGLPTGWVQTDASCVVEGDLDPVAMDPDDVTVGPGEVVICTFENFDTGQLAPVPSLTIIKDATPADGTTFRFVSDSLPDFTLSPPGTSSKQFTSLDPGLYVITEVDIPEDWTFEGVDCIAADWTAAGATVAVNLGEGEAAVCTFSNTSDLPFTGTPPWLLYLAAGGALAFLIGLVLVVLSRRRAVTSYS